MCSKSIFIQENLLVMSGTDGRGAVNLTKAGVPAYLHRGDFYGSLSEDGTSYIEVPANTIKPTTEIRDDVDLDHLLTSLRFWVVPVLPLTILNYILSDDGPCPIIDGDFYRQFPILRTLIAVRQAEEEWKVAVALKAGNPVIIHHLIAAGFRAPNDATVLAAEMGRADLVSYFHQQGYRLSSCTVSMAAFSGSMECMAYAHRHGAPWHVQTTALAAAKGSLSCLKYAYGHHCPWAPRTIENAIKFGHIECLEYAVIMQCKPHSDLAQYAAECGQLACLRFLHERGARLHRLTMLGAIIFGHVDIVRYLRWRGCPWDAEACRLAALNGRLECLMYLHEQGCPWDSGATLAAALCARFDCLQYAYDKGCEVREDCIRVLGQYESKYSHGIAASSAFEEEVNHGPEETRVVPGEHYCTAAGVVNTGETEVKDSGPERHGETDGDYDDEGYGSDMEEED
jgi:hypothetical protein